MHTRICPSCQHVVQHETKYARNHRDKNQIPCNQCLGISLKPPVGNIRYCPTCATDLVCSSDSGARRAHKEERLCASCAGRFRHPPSDTTRQKLSEVQRGKKRSPETKEKLSNKARERWQNPDQREMMLTFLARGKEVSLSDESREKMKASLKGKKRVFTQEHRERLRDACKRRSSDPEYRNKLVWSDERRVEASIAEGGSGDLVLLNVKRRKYCWKSSELSKWRIAVKRRDGRRCCHCGSTQDLHAHHIKQRASHPELAYDVENGVTLCKNCHVEEHRRLRVVAANGVR